MLVLGGFDVILSDVGAWMPGGLQKKTVQAGDITFQKNCRPNLTHALPKPNWIDQSTVGRRQKIAQACLECHIGPSSRCHASKNVSARLHGLQRRQSCAPAAAEQRAHAPAQSRLLVESSANPTRFVRVLIRGR